MSEPTPLYFFYRKGRAEGVPDGIAGQAALALYWGGAFPADDETPLAAAARFSREDPTHAIARGRYPRGGAAGKAAPRAAVVARQAPEGHREALLFADEAAARAWFVAEYFVGGVDACPGAPLGRLIQTVGAPATYLGEVELGGSPPTGRARSA